jgi:two-component system, OmpR family, KDP operon response regulator KdpE
MTNAGVAVLIVEDDPQMRRFLRATLTANHYRVLEACNAAEAVLLATSHNPALLLLDLGLPDADGLELTRRIREWSTTPIIVISARGREADKVDALDAGADDYLTKPFGVGELLARMRVALRHAQRASGATVQTALEFGTLRIDFTRREVSRGGAEVHLTPTEYRLLALLAQNAGKVLTHRQILNHVWGPNHGDHTHYVRVHMAELRKKIEEEPTRPKLIATEPGVGYRLRDRER